MSFLSLPAEIQLAIAGHLAWWDIFALRLTCGLLNSVMPRPTLCGAMPYPRGMREMLLSSFYMRIYGYFLCLGCLCIRDNTEWFAWKENLSPCELNITPKGQTLKAWKRCKRCDENWQKNMLKRCGLHGDSWCRDRVARMVRIGPRKRDEGQDAGFLWS